MKKIVEVPEGCERITFEGSYFDSTLYIQKIENPNDLEDYIEPRTADGLSMREFLKQAWGTRNKIEYNSFEKDDKWGGTATPAVEIVGNLILDNNLQGLRHFRIKSEESKLPEYIKVGNYIRFCGFSYCISEIKDSLIYLQGLDPISRSTTISLSDVENTRLIQPVKCIPWDDSEAPDSFEADNGCKYGKCFNADLGVWGYYKQGCGFLTYREVFAKIKRPNHNICGTFEVLDV